MAVNKNGNGARTLFPQNKRGSSGSPCKAKLSEPHGAGLEGEIWMLVNQRDDVSAD